MQVGKWYESRLVNVAASSVGLCGRRAVKFLTSFLLKTILAQRCTCTLPKAVFANNTSTTTAITTPQYDNKATHSLHVREAYL